MQRLPSTRHLNYALAPCPHACGMASIVTHNGRICIAPDVLVPYHTMICWPPHLQLRAGGWTCHSPRARRRAATARGRCWRAAPAPAACRRLEAPASNPPDANLHKCKVQLQWTKQTLQGCTTRDGMGCNRMNYATLAIINHNLLLHHAGDHGSWTSVTEHQLPASGDWARAMRLLLSGPASRAAKGQAERRSTKAATVVQTHRRQPCGQRLVCRPRCLCKWFCKQLADLYVEQRRKLTCF